MDSITSTGDVTELNSEDDDIQVLACHRTVSEFRPQLVAGRPMTTELTQCLNDFSLPEIASPESLSTFSETPEKLIDWLVGNPLNIRWSAC